MMKLKFKFSFRKSNCEEKENINYEKDSIRRIRGEEQSNISKDSQQFGETEEERSKKVQRANGVDFPLAFFFFRKKIYENCLTRNNTNKSFLSFLILLFSSVLFLEIAKAQIQSHPLSQITPIDVNLDMFKYNITNVTFVGINMTSPLYALDIVGDVRWTGTLRGGTVPWNLLSGYNLNVPWSGLLGWGNLTGYNLNVNWQGKLGWGNLTGYPNVITSLGSGLNISTQSLASNIILGVNFTETQKRVSGSCSGSKAIQVINADGTVTCVDINLYGNVTGMGTPGYIPVWQTSSSLTNSLLNQTSNNLWLTSGNFNILSGALQFGGITVIDSSRNIVNVGWVNASNLNLTGNAYIGGNVGIGTTSPSSKLEVVGTFNVTSSGAKFIVDANGDIWVKL